MYVDWHSPLLPLPPPKGDKDGCQFRYMYSEGVTLWSIWE